MSKQFYFKQFSLALSTQFSSICSTERILPSATTSGQSGPGSDSSEGALPKAPALQESHHLIV